MDDTGGDEKVARREQRDGGNRDPEAQLRLPASQRHAQRDDRHEQDEPGSWRHARALRNLRVRRAVLRRQMRRPIQQTEPVGHDADRRQHAIGAGDVKRCERLKRLKADDALPREHARPRRQKAHGDCQQAEVETDAVGARARGAVAASAITVSSAATSSAGRTIPCSFEKQAAAYSSTIAAIVRGESAAALHAIAQIQRHRRKHEDGDEQLRLADAIRDRFDVHRDARQRARRPPTRTMPAGCGTRDTNTSTRGQRVERDVDGMEHASSSRRSARIRA